MMQKREIINKHFCSFLFPPKMGKKKKNKPKTKTQKRNKVMYVNQVMMVKYFPTQ